MNDNIAAFLRVIREGESSQSPEAYRMMYGGQLFDGFEDHPRRAFSSPWGWTSAAGAYQAMCAVPGKVKTDTWGDFVRSVGPRQFHPWEQDEFAIWCIKRRKALEDVKAGRLEAALRKCAKEWASLPFSPYGQPTLPLQRAFEVFKRYGGRLEGEAEEIASPIVSEPKEQAPEPAQPAPPITSGMPAGEGRPQEPYTMPLAPIVAAVLPSIIESIPKLGKLFGSGSDVAERNVKAAEMAVSIVQEAVGAVNAQDAAEKIKSDPSLVAAASEAVDANWFRLAEAGGGGIDGARKANAEYMQPGKHFWLNPAFYISLVLLIMPFMLLVDVFYVHPESYKGDMRTQIVTGVLMVISMVGGYWIGTSFSSAKKDDR